MRVIPLVAGGGDCFSSKRWKIGRLATNPKCPRFYPPIGGGGKRGGSSGVKISDFEGRVATPRKTPKNAVFRHFWGSNVKIPLWSRYERVCTDLGTFTWNLINVLFSPQNRVLPTYGRESVFLLFSGVFWPLFRKFSRFFWKIFIFWPPKTPLFRAPRSEP